MNGKSEKVIWITGASSGLGRSLSLKLAAEGNSVFASARDQDALQLLAQLDSKIVALP